ncbi:MAG: hypothetical protein WA060_01965 [Minisyncoccia bacterium]
MPKYLFEDMVRSKRQRREKSGDIRISSVDLSQKETKKEPKENEQPADLKIIYEMPEFGKSKNNEVGYVKSRGRNMLWFLALVSVMFCLFALSFLFSSAEILVDPKIKEVVLNENLSANLNSNDSLSFNLVVFDDTESKTLTANGEEDVAKKATGTVVIYNSFSSAPQTLNIDTRLEGSNGKIYKTKTKTVVPGIKKGSTIPGSVEVEIYATDAGEEYNSGPLDFKIFGFKGTPKYSKFYGRSKPGTQIIGGFRGKVPSVKEEDKKVAITEMETILKAKLLKKVVTPDFVLFENAVSFNIEDANILSGTSNDNNATITLKGTIYGILFNEQKLTKKITENKIKEYDGSEVYIPNITDLVFSLPEQINLSDKGSLDFENLKSINFNLSGSAKIVSKLDKDKFTADLLGISKKDFVQILSQYPNIESAVLKLRFPWMQSIPDKTENVKVIINYPE